MKIKYSHRKITFKISKDELETLIQGQELICAFIFPLASSLEHRLQKSTLENSSLDFDNTNKLITLKISGATLDALKQPSKEGVISSYFFQEREYFFSIEVDLKSKRTENHAR
jgi:hypothetical protein